MIAPLETIKNKIERKSSIMSRFDTYFLMKEADVIEYVKAKSIPISSRLKPC